MRISVLSSGSRGNATYMETDNTKLLIDIGISCLSLKKKLYELGVKPGEIDAILITHTHIDHIAGLKTFYKKYRPQIYMTEKMYGDISSLNLISEYNDIETDFSFNDIDVEIIKTSHDVPDSNGYIIKNNNKSLVYITDTGYINVKFHSKLKNHNLYVMESNHDIELLMNGTRPYHIKQRILSDQGHLSNKQASEYLSKFCGESTQCVVLAHLSSDHNNNELALETLQSQLLKRNKKVKHIIIAQQDNKTEVVEI